MRFSFKKFAILLVIVGLTGSAMAQEGLSEGETVSQYNPNSVNPIPKYEQLYKQRVWTRVDLEQKLNKGFFAKNNEFTKIIMDAVMADQIQNVYWEDSLTRKMTKAEFAERLNKTEVDNSEPEAQPLYEVDYPYFEGDIVEYNGGNYICKKDLNDNEIGIAPTSDPNLWEVYGGEVAEKYFATDIAIMEIMEDIILDKRRARQYRDIQSVKLIVPGKYSNDGANYYIATFAYKDLERFFREHPDKAVWYNQQNSAENRNLGDAFLLRLFHGELYKIENPDNLPIASYYGGSAKQGLMASQWEEMKILEREHNLWSY
ncbi:MAG: gliding motility protein GldN [Cyclobacteriaceae bacterium]|nr:gliding motility protein GldN [Cyclobacteriaceae bacterium]